MYKLINFLLAISLPAQAQQVISVSPFQSGSYGDVSFEVPVTANNADLTMDFTLKCFAPNLRNTPSPVAPDATVTIELGLNAPGAPNTITQIIVNERTGSPPYPAVSNLVGWHFKPYYWTSTSAAIDPQLRAATRNLPVTGANGITGTAMLNKDHLRITIRGAGKATVTPSGAVNLDEVAQYAVKYIRLKQKGAPNQTYAGSDGPLNASVKYKTSANGLSIVGTIDVPAAARPGQIPAYLGGGSYDEFCGGWYSPLMVFFDEKRPLFNGHSDFLGIETYWPEKDSQGYFLVYDKNKNGKADPGELLGNLNGSDGFAVLREFDENKDQVIDPKDSIFEKLALWNGDKKTAGQLKKSKLKNHSIQSLSLKTESIIRGFGDRAEARGESTFEYSKGSEKRVGTIQDIYFRGR